MEKNKQSREYSFNELSVIVASANIALLIRETGISRHNLERLINKDKSLPVFVTEKLNEYYGAR